MKNGELTRQIEEKYVNTSKKRKVQMYFTAKAGENMQLTMIDTATGTCVTVQSDVAETAASQPAVQEKVKEQLSRLGNTAFVAEYTEADMQPNLFIPSGSLKKLRRNGAELLQKQIVEVFRRDNERTDVGFDSRGYVSDAGEAKLHALAVTEKQIEIICGMEEVNAVYCDYNIFWNKNTRASKLEHIKEMCEKNNKIMAVACPHIQRQKHNKRMYEFLTDVLLAGVDTFLVRSLETLHMLSGLAEKEEFKGRIKVIADTNFYTWNTASVLSLKEMCGKLTLLYAAYPYELTAAELVRGDIKRELVVYSRVPLMVSEQCVRKTTGLCDGQNGSISISGKNTQNTVKSMCGLCYTVMYDKKTYDISDEYEALLKIKPEVIRYEFTDEEMNPLEIIRERSVCAEVMQGHFKVGVE
jgi:putative protease